MLKISSVWEAVHNIKDFARVTPLLTSTAQSRGPSLYLKAESLQTTGSFKLRGAANAITRAKAAQPSIPGVTAASSGNHGQAVAFVAGMLNIPAIIVMPETAPRIKVEAVKRYGAQIEMCGTTSQERLARVKEVCREKGFLEIPPYDHPDTLAGQGTIGKEILEQLPAVDVILVPIGGGGLISGISLTVKTLNPRVRVIGVEPEGSNSMYVSFKKGEITQLEKTESIADGLLTLRPGRITFPLVKKYVDDIRLVTEQDIRAAIKLCLETYKLVPEPSGAVSLAAALQGDWAQGSRIVAVISGGNVDLDKLSFYTRP